jgi:hypothetical protein
MRGRSFLVVEGDSDSDSELGRMRRRRRRSTMEADVISMGRKQRFSWGRGHLL